MSLRRILIPLFVMLILGLILVSCAPSNTPPAPTAAGILPGTELEKTATPSADVPSIQVSDTAANPVATTSETTVTPTAMAVLGTPIGDWKEAPVMPEISQHVIQIYQDGQRQGRDLHAFSVIGDCQAVPVVFMGDYELGKLEPPAGEEYLWDVIHNFKGSFARWGMSVRGGFTAASVLSPLQADPQSCKSGETPLTCEYRIHNPAFVFITLETWLDPPTVDRYDGYLRRILDYVISHGSVPILLTKADSSEMRNGTHVFNPVIIQAAHDYDVPVINFWRAAQMLDNGGIDPNREGFHLSPDGYKLKNTLALRTFYNVWKVATSGDTGAAVTETESTATPSATPTATAQPVPVPNVPNCEGGGCIFFGAAGSQDGVVAMQGVYAYSYGTKQKIQVMGDGYNLQDVSQDGKRLLVNNANYLYEVNLADRTSKLLSDSFYSLGKQGAYWDKDESGVVFLDKDQPLQTAQGYAYNYYPDNRDGERYFESGTCQSQDFCQPGGVYKIDSSGSPVQMSDLSSPIFSPDGKLVAYLNPEAATDLNWHHINYLLVEDVDKGIGSRRVFYLPDDHIWMRYPDIRSVVFSPDSSKLFIIQDVYSEYFENSLRLQTYMIDLNTGILYEYGQIKGLYGSFKPQVVWSPDGDKVLFFLTTVTTDNLYTLGIYQTKFGTEERLNPYEQDMMTSNEYFYITNIYWR